MPIVTSASNLRCIFLNAHSIAKPGACDAFLGYCLLNDIDIAMVAETWLSTAVSDAELSGRGHYSVYRKDRETIGGGVCILVKATIDCREVKVFETCELICVDVFVSEVTLRFACVYLSNSGGSIARKARVRAFCNVLDSICDIDHPVFICGDFNLPLIDWKK